jgi:hypothetical protein
LLYHLEQIIAEASELNKEDKKLNTINHWPKKEKKLFRNTAGMMHRILC